MSLFLVSGKLAFLHDGNIAAIENCCAPIVVKCTLFATCIASLLLGTSFNDICYDVIDIRSLVQYKVVATELYT